MLLPMIDIRSIMFGQFIPKDGEFRKRLLARISLALNHQLRQAWLSSLVARYRQIATDYLGPGRHGQALDSILKFMDERPPLLRAELEVQFDVGPVYQCAVRMAQGASATIDGHGYDHDETFHYFAGQEMQLLAGTGCEVRLEGEVVAPGTRAFVVNDNLHFEIVRL